MPRWLTQARLRLRTLFHGDRVERELDEELRYHLEREIDERLAAGLTMSEARFEARRSMGAITQNKEACRENIPPSRRRRSSCWRWASVRPRPSSVSSMPRCSGRCHTTIRRGS